ARRVRRSCQPLWQGCHRTDGAPHARRVGGNHERSREIYGPLGWRLNETEKMWRAPDGTTLHRVVAASVQGLLALIERLSSHRASPSSVRHSEVPVPEQVPSPRKIGEVKPLHATLARRALLIATACGRPSCAICNGRRSSWPPA